MQEREKKASGVMESIKGKSVLQIFNRDVTYEIITQVVGIVGSPEGGAHTMRELSSNSKDKVFITVSHGRVSISTATVHSCIYWSYQNTSHLVRTYHLGSQAGEREKTSA
jgi:hypothetical protein